MMSSEEPDFDEYYFKVWKTYEHVAMHFNDLIIRLRIQSIGGLAALATILGIVLKSNNGNNETFNYGFAILAISFLILCWIAIWNLDLRYYNRLLEGSVNAILELEKKKEMFFKKKEIALSSNIERAFKVRFEHESKKWTDRIFNGRNLFYLIVLSALVIILLSTIVLCCRDCKQKEIESGTSQKVENVSKDTALNPLALVRQGILLQMSIDSFMVRNLTQNRRNILHLNCVPSYHLLRAFAASNRH